MCEINRFNNSWDLDSAQKGLMNSTPPISNRKVWWTTIVAGMASYLDAGAIVTTGTALTLYQDSLGISGTQYGQLSSLLTIMIALGALVGGPLSDRLGRKTIFAATILIYAVGALIMMLAPSVGLLYIGVILLGFASGADLPPSLAIIAETAPDSRRGKMISFTHVLWMLAIPIVNGIGILVGGMDATGARIMYGHLLVVAVIVLVLRWSLPESSVWKQNQQNIKSGVIQRSSVFALLSPKYLPSLVALSLFYALTNIESNTNGQFSTYLYVNEAGVDVSVASAMNLVGQACGLLASLFLMRIVDTKWRIPAFAISIGIMAIAYSLPAIVGVSVLILMIVRIAGTTAGIICGEPIFKVWAQELFPTELRGSAQGVAIAFTRTIAAAVALLTPGLIEHGVPVLYGFIVCTTLLSGAVGLFWIRRRPTYSSDLQPEAGSAAEAAAPRSSA